MTRDNVFCVDSRQCHQRTLICRHRGRQKTPRNPVMRYERLCHVFHIVVNVIDKHIQSSSISFIHADIDSSLVSQYLDQAVLQMVYLCQCSDTVD